MSILIKGMEMPKEGTVIAIYKLDGKFFASVHGTELCPLVPVPPHGRLVDIADVQYALIMAGQHSKRYKLGETWELNLREIMAALETAPTIIPAEEGEA